MDHSQSVIPSPPGSDPLALTGPVRGKFSAWKHVLALLTLAGLGGIGVYGLDPWGWRTTDRGLTVASLLARAQKAIEERDFGQAKNHLLHLLEVLPFNAEAHFLLAQTCRREEDFGAWRAHLMVAGRLQWPQQQIDFEIQLQRAQSGDVWKVEAPLLEALKTKSAADVELILEVLAEGYLKNRSLTKIMELTGPWIDRSPDDWLPHVYRGHIQYREGSRTQAIAEYQTALKLNPEHNGAQLLLAGALMDDGQFKEALRLYEMFLRENPGDANGLWGLANCQFSLAQTAAARDILKPLLSVSPHFVKALVLMGKIELVDDKPEEALKLLRKAERLARGDADITHLMIIVLHRLNRTEDAEKYIKRQQEILHLSDDLNKVRKQLRRDPSNVDLVFQMGQLNIQLDRDDEAYDWFEMALRLDPTHAKTRMALEEWWAKNGEPAPSPPGQPGKK